MVNEKRSDEIWNQFKRRTTKGKAGDAKLWVYRHENDHDRQPPKMTEKDSSELFDWFEPSQAFYSDGLSSLQECYSITAPRNRRL